MTAEFYRRRWVRAYGVPAGSISEWGDGRWRTYDRDGSYLSQWSTQRRALHAIEQDMLLELYGTHERAANDS